MLAVLLVLGLSGVTMKKGNVLFNNALNTFYLWLYGVRHMVEDHSDSERGSPLPPHGLLFLINSKDSFICTIPDRIAHTTTFVTQVVRHWLEWEISLVMVPTKNINIHLWTFKGQIHLILWTSQYKIKESGTEHTLNPE